ncbi:ATP-binding protein [Anaerotignum lactatifermentans]|jgi:tRNA methyl transferase|uniref:PP-loop family protein n=1 Tax=Anaerotignum lactatifermentans DSM 14214 TaxID=1121323 RepID=A0A1M6RCF1_9FIRM|nr:ATP-binding protein [Anaerotignum lactatifermentans]SHK30080.1 PP-loop family protein [[Clostridium] lactatifermentans DSM 14214] [Anaerotignum lactatifermentans DSM 14214]
MEKYSIVKKSNNPKVIAMLSGGKDSIAAVILLKKSGIDVTAIHFVHKWGAAIPTEEAKRICAEYQIPLIIKDYTEEFCNAVNGYTAGRPCLLCKKQMYKVLLSYLQNNEFGWLCIGDNSNDRTTIARIKQFINDGHPEDNLLCSAYFGSEMGIVLPEGMKVIRPLIDMSAKDIENFFRRENIVIKRINSTGDKYFEYHREGCPVQFADIGVELNEKLYADLKKYNDCITEFAREEGILASIHMPSTFIITIPRGREEQALDYLEMHGLSVNRNINSTDIPSWEVFIGYVYELNRNLLDTGAYEKVFNRFLERMELYGEGRITKRLDDVTVCTYTEKAASLELIFNFSDNKASITYSFNNDALSRKDKQVFDNLILEMFRTRKYKVVNAWI